MLQDGPQLGHVKIMKFLRASSFQPRTRPQSVDLYRIPIFGDPSGPFYYTRQ